MTALQRWLWLLVACHTWVHGQTLRVSGDADGRMADSGSLCGLKIERKTDGRWRSEGYR